MIVKDKYAEAELKDIVKYKIKWIFKIVYKLYINYVELYNFEDLIQEEKMNLNFRTLKASEIDVKPQTVKENGFSLLLYKNARVEMKQQDL